MINEHYQKVMLESVLSATPVQFVFHRSNTMNYTVIEEKFFLTHF